MVCSRDLFSTTQSGIHSHQWLFYLNFRKEQAAYRKKILKKSQNAPRHVSARVVFFLSLIKQAREKSKLKRNASVEKYFRHLVFLCINISQFSFSGMCYTLLELRLFFLTYVLMYGMCGKNTRAIFLPSGSEFLDTENRGGRQVCSFPGRCSLSFLRAAFVLSLEGTFSMSFCSEWFLSNSAMTQLRLLSWHRLRNSERNKRFKRSGSYAG